MWENKNLFALDGDVRSTPVCVFIPDSFVLDTADMGSLPTQLSPADRLGITNSTDIAVDSAVGDKMSRRVC